MLVTKSKKYSPWFKTAVLATGLTITQTNHAPTDPIKKDGFIPVSFNQAPQKTKNEILEELLIQNQMTNKKLVEFLKNQKITGFEQENQNISQENTKLSENLKLISSSLKTSNTIEKQTAKEIYNLIEDVNNYKKDFFLKLNILEQIKKNDFYEIDESLYSIITQLEKLTQIKNLLTPDILKKLSKQKESIKKEALEKIKILNPEGSKALNLEFVMKHLGDDFHTFLFYNRNHLKKAIEFDLSKEKIKPEDNLTIIIQSNEQDNAYMGSNQLWFKTEKPVLVRFADNEDDLKTVQKKLLDDPRDLKNKVRNMIFSFHGSLNGMQLKTNQVDDEKYNLDLTGNKSDLDLINELIDDFANLLRTDGATIFLNSCGNDFRDNVTAKIFIEKLIIPAMEKSPKIKSVRLIGSKTSFSENNIDAQINPDNTVKNISIKSSSNTIDTLIKRDGQDITILENTFSKDKLHQDLDSLEKLLEKNTGSKNSQEKLLDTYLQNTNPDTNKLQSIQNSFVNFHNSTKSLINELFFTIKSINSSDTRPESFHDKKELLKRIDNIYMGYKKNLNSNLIKGLTDNYAFDEFKAERFELINKMFNKEELNDRDLLFEIIKINPEKISEDNFKNLKNDKEFLKKIILHTQENLEATNTNDFLCLLESIPVNVIASTEVKKIARELSIRLEKKIGFLEDIYLKSQKIVDNKSKNSFQFINYANLNIEAHKQSFNLLHQKLDKNGIKISQEDK